MNMDISRRSAAFIEYTENVPYELITCIKTANNENFLATLSVVALQPHLTTSIFAFYEPLALELCVRWKHQKHTAVVAAFGRILEQHPHFTEVAQRTLSQDDIQSNLLREIESLDLSDDPCDLVELLLGVLRLLQFNNEIFGRLIRPAILQKYFSHQNLVVRYLAIRVLCHYLHASDAVVQNLISKYLGEDKIEGPWEGKAIDYRFLPLWDQKRVKDIKNLVANRDFPEESNLLKERQIADEELSLPVTNVYGTLLLKQSSNEAHHPHASTSFVSTPTSALNMGNLAKSLLHDEPILVTGPDGSGKTHSIRDLASRLGKSAKLITLHLNSQSDMKLLIGIYTTGPDPGSFRWNPGILTTAIKEGHWVLIEDLDHVPAEAMSILLPLIERRELLIPGQNKPVKASIGFKLFATMRSQINLRGEDTVNLGRTLGIRFWRRINFREPEILDIRQIVLSKYSIVSEYFDMMTRVYQKIIDRSTATQTHAGLLGSRLVRSRELFKWCGRIADCLLQSGCKTGGEAVPETVLDCIFLDAMDCFAGSIEVEDVRMSVADLIVPEMHIDPQRKNWLMRLRKPHFHSSKASSSSTVSIGRASLTCTRNKYFNWSQSTTFDFDLNNHTLRLLERIGVAVGRRESILLVGETGIGKTSVVQHLAKLLGHKVTAINLSQQSESGDFLGGYKPIDIRSFMIPLKDEFDRLYEETFNTSKNKAFTNALNRCIAKGEWERTLKLWREAVKTVNVSSENGKGNTKKRKLPTNDTEEYWRSFGHRLQAVEQRISKQKGAFAFEFIEGKFINAVRNGDWVLLDEINLATPDTLECIAELLDSGSDSRPSVTLSETGRTERIEAHPEFRLFAAMNPANDTGKKNLPPSIRNLFTELFVHSLEEDKESLESLIRYSLEAWTSDQYVRKMTNPIADLYLDIQHLSKAHGLVDGSGHPPVYSIRSLTRALNHARNIAKSCTVKRAIYEGFCMCFLTCLHTNSEDALHKVIVSKIFGDTKTWDHEMRQPMQFPDDNHKYVIASIDVHGLDITGSSIKRNKPTKTAAIKSKPSQKPSGLLLPLGGKVPERSEDYIVTPYIWRNLQNLARAILTRKHPVLIQGPTSAGKTTMVEFLAKRSGNKFIRINNHEHTDVQEYLGTYVSNDEGQIVFQEGLLIQALRQGSWVVLDELNLAPSDVLEALNRLLDDNRELVIPETQEIIRPHPNFMLFATQNPSGAYGGRKTLSRAFRNRFIELHFDDIPVDELEIILATRSGLPASWCKKIVGVYRSLAKQRQDSRAFEQHSFATLRDLFRWALRENNTDKIEVLADNGYMLLAEKVRTEEERQVVKAVVEKEFSGKGVRIHIDDEVLYSRMKCQRNFPNLSMNGQSLVWTKSMARLFTLVFNAIQNNEPILLIGETGCGKTTVCQMLAKVLEKDLHIFNANQHTETGDLIGAQRPMRHRAALDASLMEDLLLAMNSLMTSDGPSPSVETMLKEYDNYLQREPNAIEQDIRERIKVHRRRRKALFEWQDGSIVRAMRNGDLYLLDEISLAEDSVLERLNSILDPQRSILLAEKGTKDSLVAAKPGFQFMATMNPGGDYGKKELSVALRNRFTEIWVPPMTDTDDVLQIVQDRLHKNSHCAEAMVKFAKWFGERFRPLKAASISVRDILAWVDFVNLSNDESLCPVVQGAAMVFIDTLGANPSGMISSGNADLNLSRSLCLTSLADFLGIDQEYVLKFYHLPLEYRVEDDLFSIARYTLEVGMTPQLDKTFNFEAPTTRRNVMRIARGLQVSKPILLEGNPGVGKTSLVSALASVTGNPLTRINLSEQTDLMDLFGSDVPVEGAEAGVFAWKDAPFLKAMKRGEWVLLDEMNLASQSILEGLNACLDHRGTVYVSELDQTFSKHPKFRLFAAQNPHHQGGGRKGLPASFVNRFTVVYADVFVLEDLELICKLAFPSIDPQIIAQLVAFISALDKQVTHDHAFGFKGAPWEFNLRDAMRVLQLLSSERGLLPSGDPFDFIDIVLGQRFRSKEDRSRLRQLYENHFIKTNSDDQEFSSHIEAASARLNSINLGLDSLQVGLGLLRRSDLICDPSTTTVSIPARLPSMEAIMIAVQQQWPIVLVGPAGVGKSHLIYSLAAFLGIQIEVISLSSDVDATDLVGAYEQVDPNRQCLEILDSMRSLIQCYLVHQIDISQGSSSHDFDSLLDDIFSSINRANEPSDYSYIMSSLDSFYENLFEKMDTESLSLRNSLKDMLSNFRHFVQMVQTDNATARFEWLDGKLVKALESGSWLILDNANLCSASVLDRLNSLLEPDGSLIINENTSADGSVRFIKPHPNFRIFLNVDPQYGELSRAMRNRSLEIYVSPIEVQEDFSTQQGLIDMTTDSRLFRFGRFLQVTSNHDMASVQTLQLAVDNISYGDMNHLSSFLNQIKLGLVDLPARETAHAACRRLSEVSMASPTQFLTHSHFRSKAIARIWASSHLLSSQPINVLNNQQLALYNVQGSRNICKPFFLALIQDLTFEIIEFKRIFHDLQRSQQSLNTMSRLKRALEANRNLRFAKDTTHWTASFLVDYLETLWQTLQSLWTKFSQVEDAGSESMKYIQIFQPLRMLTMLYNLLFHQLNELPFNEMALDACMSIVWKHVSSVDAYEEAVAEASFKIRHKLADHYEKSNFEEALTMETLWRSFRPSQASVEKFILDPRNDLPVPFFHSTFQKFCSYIDLLSFNENTYHPSPRHDLTKGEELSFDLISEKLVRKRWETPAEALEALIVSISRNDDNGSLPSMLFGDIMVETIQKLSIADEVQLQQLDLLEQEFNILGRYFSTNPKILCTNLAQRLSEVIRFISDEVRCGVQLLIDSGDNFPIAKRSANAIRAYVETFATVEIPIQRGDWISLEKLGRAIVGVALACLHLYIPSHASDPALRSNIYYSLFENQIESLRQKAEALQSLETFMSGSATSLRRSLALDQMNESLRISPRPPEVKGRSSVPLLNLQSIFDSIRGLCVRVEGIYHNFPENEKNSKEFTRDALLENIHQVLLRLQQSDSTIRDVWRPAMGFLNILRVGVCLSTCSTSKQNSQIALAEFALTSTPMLQDRSNDWPPEALLRLSEDVMQEKAFHQYRLKLLGLVHRVEGWKGSRGRDTRTQIYSSLRYLYDFWAYNLGIDRQKEAAASSLYDYRGGLEMQLNDDEQEFTLMFPEHETKSDETRQALDQSKEKARSLAIDTAKLHVSIFVNARPATDQLMILFEDATRLIACAGDNSNILSPKVSTESLLAVSYLQIKKKIDLLQGQRINSYNIYTDSNVKEAKRVVLITHEIRSWFNDVVKIWPEHATLHNLLITCDEILAFKHTEPVVKYLTKTEKLHAYVDEWQTVTSADYSAKGLQSKLTDLLISWRQLELSTWARLLDLEIEKCTEDAYSWYFLAYENIIAIPRSRDDPWNFLLQYLEVLDSFLTKSSLGQFCSRLDMVCSMLKLLKEELMCTNEYRLKDVHDTIEILYNRFDRHRPNVEDAISSHRQRLDKEIRNIIQTASWRDRNIITLRQSAKASHRQLFKIIRKFREALAGPVENVLAQVTTPLVLKIADTSARLRTYQSYNLLTDMNFRSYVNPEELTLIESALQDIKNVEITSSPELDTKDGLESFLEDLQTAIQDLQKSTPAVLTEDNKAEVKRLTVRKRVLLSDTLKKLSEMGFKFQLDSETLASQDSKDKVLNRLSTQDPQNFQDAARAEHHLHRLIDSMSQVRAAKAEHSEDLTQSDVDRSIGFLEGMLSKLIWCRQFLAEVSHERFYLDKWYYVIQQFWGEEGVTIKIAQQNIEDRLQSLKLVVYWLPTIIATGIKMLEAQSELSQLDFTEVIANLSQWQSTFEGLASRIEELPKVLFKLMHVSTNDFLSESLSSLQQCRISLERSISKFPIAELVLKQVLSWVYVTELAPQEVAANDNNPWILKNLNNDVHAISHTITYSMKRVASQQSQTMSVTDQEWLTKDLERQENVLKDLQYHSVRREIFRLVTPPGRLGNGQNSLLSAACASASSTLPLLDEYQRTLHKATEELGSTYFAMCKLAHHLAESFCQIATQGFCKPSEKSNEGKTSDRLESGTGLGAGEGAEDISKDVGEDEDISELAQDGDHKNQNADVEDHEDAIDIEDTLIGDKGAGAEKDDTERQDDASNTDENEKTAEAEGDEVSGCEGSDGDQEDIDMTEGVGNVDDLEASAKDEKTLDKPGDQTGKQKQGEVKDQDLAEDKNGVPADGEIKDFDEAKDKNQEHGEESSGEDDGSEMLDSPIENRTAAEPLDPHLENNEGLELPDDLRLDGDKDENKSASDQDTLDDEFEVPETDNDNMDMAETTEDSSDMIEEGNGAHDPMNRSNEENTRVQDSDEEDGADQQDNNEREEQGNGGEDENGNAGIGSKVSEREPKTTQSDNVYAGEPTFGQDESTEPSSGARGRRGRQTEDDQTAADKQENANSRQEDSNVVSQDKANFKQLGSASERWHKQQRKIQDSTIGEDVGQRDQMDVEMTDADYEHLPDKNAEADTQALGASMQDQPSAFDENMAIPVDESAIEKQRPQQFMPDVEDKDGSDAQDTTMRDNAQHSMRKEKSESDVTRVGERKPMSINTPKEVAMDISDDESMKSVKEELSIIDLRDRQDLSSTPNREQSSIMWHRLDSSIHTLALALTEQLRLILEPTMATKLRGDFKTGKRLNIKRIIPYIASNYKRDKIWMRRSVPTKRVYQLLLAIDDSRSMRENGSADLAFATMALVAKSLSMLEAGEMGVLAFGQKVEIAHELDKPFTSDAGPEVLEKFSFAQDFTNVKKLVEDSLQILNDARFKSSTGFNAGSDLWQLQFILSDGIFQDHEAVRRLLLKAQEERIMVIFIIVDAAKAAKNDTASNQAQKQQESSIVDLESVEFVQGPTQEDGQPGEMTLRRRKYLDTFPFSYYLIVKDVRDLPNVLATALRQWFAEVASQ